MNIREYQEEDKGQILDLIAELQDYEARYVPGMKPGKEMADNYLDFILKWCVEKGAQILVAEEDSQLIGFTWFLVEKLPTDIMFIKPADVFVEIADFVVSEDYRNRGVGRALIKKVEEYAKDKGIDKVKLHVTASNKLGREIYEKLGFHEEEVILTKEI